ncbi:MAG: LapA family protein [Burkholderiales bacterium]
MQWLGALIFVSLAALAGFAALNWTVLSTPVALSFLFFTAEAPPGLILLGTTLAFAVVFLAYASVQRTTLLIESRRHMQEMSAQRDLAERAEASRLIELRAEVKEQGERQVAALRDLEAGLRHALDEAANGIAAHVGEVEDKLDRLREP